MSLIPALPRVKTFRSRSLEFFSDGKWRVDYERSHDSIDEQINAWIAETGSKISQTPAAPAISLYKDAVDRQTVITTISLLYFPAVEGNHDPAE